MSPVAKDAIVTNVRMDDADAEKEKLREENQRLREELEAVKEEDRESKELLLTLTDEVSMVCRRGGEITLTPPAPLLHDFSINL